MAAKLQRGGGGVGAMGNQGRAGQGIGTQAVERDGLAQRDGLVGSNARSPQQQVRIGFRVEGLGVRGGA